MYFFPEGKGETTKCILSNKGILFYNYYSILFSIELRSNTRLEIKIFLEHTSLDLRECFMLDCFYLKKLQHHHQQQFKRIFSFSLSYACNI